MTYQCSGLQCGESTLLLRMLQGCGFLTNYEADEQYRNGRRIEERHYAITIVCHIFDMISELPCGRGNGKDTTEVALYL